MSARLRLMSAALAAASFVATGALAAEPQAPRDVTEELLSEVRLLRTAIERSSLFAARAQLLTGQLSIQERRLTRALGDLQRLQRDLDDVDAELAQFRLITSDMEARIEQAGYEERAALESELERLPTRVGVVERRRSEIEARRVRAVQAMQVEQDRYDDLDGRLYQLERDLIQAEP